MNNYIFSVIAGACVFEIVTELLPLASGSTLKKYVKYIFSLILAICICAPIVGGALEIGELHLSLPHTNTPSPTPNHIYFEDATAYKCTPSGIPDYTQKQAVDLYIRECFSGIINNSKAAISEKFSIEPSRITLGIAFDLTNTENIKMICGNVGVEDANIYLESDVRQYLENMLQIKMGGLG